MSSENLEELFQRLRELNDILKGGTFHDLKATPAVAAEVEHMVALLADRELLKEQEFYTLEQAYEKICDAFQKGDLPRMKSFAHCGQSHPYHVLQTYVVCPICRKYRAKTRGLLGQDEIEDVAGFALHWLGIDLKAIPGWNHACNPEVA